MSIARTKIYTFVSSTLLTVFLTSMQSISYADEYVKNGLPCVKEICVGDGLDELSKVNWDKSKLWKNPQYTKYVVERFNDNYRGNLKKSKDYIVQNTFDSTGLKYFSDVKASCLHDLNPVGTYTSKDGNQTKVTIGLVPDSKELDSLEQKWTVVWISRHYLVKSDQQRSEIYEANKERYKSLTEAPGSGFNRSDFHAGKLELSMNQRPNIIEHKRLNPLCGGSEKVKID